MTEVLRSLLRSEKNASEDRVWLTKVSDFVDVIEASPLFESVEDDVVRNVAYNLKYIEYLTVQIRELVLDSVIEKMIHKEIIIRSASVLEARNIAVSQEVLETKGWGCCQDEIERLRQLRHSVHLENTNKDTKETREWEKIQKEDARKSLVLLHSLLSFGNEGNETLAFLEKGLS